MLQKTKNKFSKNFKHIYIIFERIINSPLTEVVELPEMAISEHIVTGLDQSTIPEESTQNSEHIQSEK